MPLDSFDRDVTGQFPVDAEVRALWSGGGWLEGQTWLPATDGLLFRNVPTIAKARYRCRTRAPRQIIRRDFQSLCLDAIPHASKCMRCVLP